MATKKTTEEKNEVINPVEVASLNIYQKMQLITQEISAVAKNLNVGFGQSQYKATGEADVLAAVKPIEAKYGVYSYPLSRSIVDSGTLENIKKDGTIAKSQFLRVETVYRFVNQDNPTEFVDMTSYGDGVDTQDKAPGKAMTYSDKYSLLKAYKIITGDDPDQSYSQEYTSYNVKSAKTAPKTTTPKPQAPAQPAQQTNGPIQGYPSRAEMIDVCKEHFVGDNLQNLLAFYKAESIDKLGDAQLAVAYGKAMQSRTA